jgi:hypothetical protein
MERESAEKKATSRRAERLASLLMLSYEPMFMWRLDGAIELWNAGAERLSGAERLYGFAPNEAVGSISHALLKTKFPIPFIELRSQLLNNRYWSGELRHICKDGSKVTVDSRMQLLGGDTVLEVNRNVSEVKALAAAQATLIRCAVLSKGSFLTQGVDVIGRSALRNHPVFGHYLQVSDLLRQYTANVPVDLYFALPGDPFIRPALSSLLPPPIALL